MLLEESQRVDLDQEPHRGHLVPAEPAGDEALQREAERRGGGAQLVDGGQADAHPFRARSPELLAKAAAGAERLGPVGGVPLGLLTDVQRGPGERVQHPLLHGEEGKAPRRLERTVVKALGDLAEPGGSVSGAPAATQARPVST